MGDLKLARTWTMATPLLDKRAIFRELQDARIPTTRTVAVRDEDVAIRSDRNGIRLIQSIRTVARFAGFAEGHQDLSVLVQLENLMAFTVLSLAVAEPQVSILVHQKAVGKNEHPLPKALQQLSGRIEFEDGRQARARAAIGAASFGDPDVTVGSNEYRAGRSHGAPLGKCEPMLDC